MVCVSEEFSAHTGGSVESGPGAGPTAAITDDEVTGAWHDRGVGKAFYYGSAIFVGFVGGLFAICGIVLAAIVIADAA
jgi:hypothetical protein